MVRQDPVRQGKRWSWQALPVQPQIPTFLGHAAPCSSPLPRRGQGQPVGQSSQRFKSQACEETFPGQGSWAGKGTGSPRRGWKPIKPQGMGQRVQADREGPRVRFGRMSRPAKKLTEAPNASRHPRSCRSGEGALSH